MQTSGGITSDADIERAAVALVQHFKVAGRGRLDDIAECIGMSGYRQIGIIIAGLVNIFVGLSALQFAISVIGVIVFTGLTAYDTQRIKQVYLAADPADITTKKAIIGALMLYLDFINLFMMLLQLTGQRRDQ